MRFDQNPQLKRELLDRLRSKYLTEKPLPHLTEVLYCLTRSYFDRRDPLPPSDQELLYFAVGFGLEEVLLRDKNSEAPESEERNGLWLTPDYVTLSGGELDLKSTANYSLPDGTPKFGWPETWIEQFQAYAYHMSLRGLTVMTQDETLAALPETVEYSVGVLYLHTRTIEVGTFTFTKQELLDNWERVRGRLAVYMLSHSLSQVPEPFQWNKNWECKNCRYLIRCQTINRGG